MSFRLSRITRKMSSKKFIFYEKTGSNDAATITSLHIIFWTFVETYSFKYVSNCISKICLNKTWQK